MSLLSDDQNAIDATLSFKTSEQLKTLSYLMLNQTYLIKIYIINEYYS